ncbi:hypothetical protein [Lysobacter solisilvae (ex Woo and Kim 2020)]|uniref:DUF4124 domain-containing protein n=1 Tax=Agrilutibacter terrestris TaxID=2865112 RepID=A0A7H0G0M5_9GAMM|nr:hypothetical protein [Lysobacter terrestris]QNP41841.1 hypothetical protein H8B22_06500 [Lysobacter terrestris]
MSKLYAPLALALSAALLAAPAAAQTAGKGAKKLYCWNENGRKVCGDALPASAADAARTEFSAKSGLATGQVDRALTPGERAAAAAQAKLDEQAQFREAALRMRERAMAESYATEADLRRAFNERIALLDDTIKAAQLSIGGLRQSLISLLRQAGEAELSGRPVPANLTGTIQTQHAELLRQQGLLVNHRQDRAEIDTELAHALQTYRTLKTPGAAAEGGGA